MKKNRMMRLASVLLVCVLLTTSVISGTFAKYVSDAEASDTARVAKWGVVVTATTDNIFDTKYAKNPAETYTGAWSVDAGSDDVVAPGTTKVDLTDLTLSGTPEVAARVTYSATLTLTGWEDANGDEYCPLVFTVEGNEYKIGDAGIDTIAALVTAVQDAVADCSQDYNPNDDLSGKATNDAPTVTWSWPFSTSADNDIKDTYLGDVAAGKYPGKTAATIALETRVLIEQID